MRRLFYVVILFSFVLFSGCQQEQKCSNGKDASGKACSSEDVVDESSESAEVPASPPPVVFANCGNINHGDSESRIRFESLIVPHGSVCRQQIQTRTCQDGNFTSYSPNNFQHSSCEVDQPIPPPTPEKVEVEVPIENIISSSDDGNVASNILDNNLNTRWSANGIGEAVELYFDGEYEVTRVEIAFYKGDIRSTYFDIDLYANGTYENAISSNRVTSQRNLQLVSYPINSTLNANVLKLIGLGNDFVNNNWNSVTELKVYGYKLNSNSATPPPPPVFANCGNINHGASETRTMYEQSSVPFGSQCLSEVQTRSCNDGVLSSYQPSNYQFTSCTVASAPTQPPSGSGNPTVILSNALNLLDNNETGRQSSARLKVPGVDPLPAGAFFNGASLTLSQNFTDPVFSNWLLDNITLVVQTTDVEIVDNHFTVTGPSGIYFMIDIYTNAKNIKIKHNNFFGRVGNRDVSAAIFQRTSGSGVNTRTSSNLLIERNRFKHLSDDGVKLAGSADLINNAFYAFSNAPKKPVNYIQGQVYDTDDTVNYNRKTYVSNIDNNSATPGGNGWRWIGSHCDGINYVANVGTSRVFGNLVIWDPQNINIPVADRSYVVGVNSALYPIRNGSSDSTYDTITFEENVVLGVITYYPITASSNGKPNWSPPVFRNNLVDRGLNRAYFYPTGRLQNDIIIDNNYDATTFNIFLYQ